MSDVLHLCRREAVSYLDRFANSLESCNGRPVSVLFTKSSLVGDAAVDNFSTDVSNISVGIKGLSGKFDLPVCKVSDLSFVRTVVSLYHEYGHYLQNYGKRRRPELAISEISVAGNKAYYGHAWPELPHEINAEALGVSMAWDALESEFPGKADGLMKMYVDYRSHMHYMLKPVPGGYKSRKDIMSAFRDSMERALNNPREKQPFMDSYKDEFTRLLTAGKGRAGAKASPHWQALIDTMPGRDKDRHMAALAVHLHPELVSEHPIVAGDDFSIEHVFGIPFPETSNESRTRIGLGNLDAQYDASEQDLNRSGRSNDLSRDGP